MERHDELDQLSAYLDGELDAVERARLDAHIGTCAECRATLTGLQATLVDLKTLPEPAPTPQDSWALRAAVRRARSPMGLRWQRYAAAAGAVAAAAIAIVAITVPNNNPARDLASAPQAEALADLSAVPLSASTKNLTALEAHQRLLDAAGADSRYAASIAPRAAIPGSTTDSTAGGTGTLSEEQVEAFAAGPEAERAQIANCVEVVNDSTQIFLEPLKFEVANFEGRPAFLLYFYAADHYELWVTRRSDCGILYFAQTD